MNARLYSAILTVFVLATPASAAQVTISDAWIRALPAKLPAAGYFTLRNTGETAFALTGAQSPACGMLMLHQSTDMGGMGGMQDVESVSVAAGATLKFAPGSYHLMCTEPTPAIKPGAVIPVTLQFSDGTKVTAKFAVKNARGN